MVASIRGYIAKLPIFIRASQRYYFRKYVEKNNSIVVFDVGCGDGWILHSRLPKTVRTIKYFDHKLDSNPRFEAQRFTLCDISNIPEDSGSADAIVMSSVIQVVENPKDVLEEARRLLGQEGNLVLSTPEGYPLIKLLLSSETFCKILHIFVKRRVTYESLLEETNLRYKIAGVGFFDLQSLEELLDSTGFCVIETQQAPKFFVSTVFQLLLFYRYIFNRKSLTSKLDWVFFPLLMLDRIFPISILSIERVINAKVK